MFYNKRQVKNISWFPKSEIGKKALQHSVFAVLWGVLLPVIPFPSYILDAPASPFLKSFIIIFIGGPMRMLILLVLVILAFTNSTKALFKIKDRSILGWIWFGILCIIAVFWLFFMVGEFTTVLPKTY
jgi:hypothetical protein